MNRAFIFAERNQVIFVFIHVIVQEWYFPSPRKKFWFIPRSLGLFIMPHKKLMLYLFLSFLDQRFPP